MGLLGREQIDGALALALIGIDPLLLTETDPRGLISGDRSRDA